MKATTNRSMIMIIQRTLDFVDSRLVHHGKRVAGTVCRMLMTQGRCDSLTIRDLCFLALIHDIGAYKTEEIDRMMNFEQDDVWSHSIYGALFVRHLTPLGSLAPVIQYHHASVAQLAGVDPNIAEWAQIFHLADRADIYLQNPRNDPRMLRAHLEAGCNSRFDEDLLRLFAQADDRYEISSLDDEDEFLMEAISKVPYTTEEIGAYFRTIISAIDFRSHHTVTHTVCTTNISRSLAGMMGITGEALDCIIFGAMLHDLGKIGIPVEILEFPGKLSPQAMRVMRTHVDLSDEILRGNVNARVLEIALRHHEKLNGEGYPHGHSAQSLTTEQRIVAVADIMSALCGTRSYKDAFSKEKTVGILSQSVERGEIDAGITALLIERYDEIYNRMEAAATPVRELYQSINEQYRTLMLSIA